MKYLIILIALSGCGHASQSPAKAVASFVALTQPAVVVQPTIETKTICGVQFTLENGLVYSNSVVVSNGSYSTGGYYPAPSFYVPGCQYLVIDGSVCLQGQTCNGNSW